MGYKDFAENRVQETQNKFSEVIKSTSINLNLIGPLQSNKVKQALSLFDNIQSVDRKKIVNEILKHKNHNTKTQNFFIQVNIGNETQKSGVLTHELDAWEPTVETRTLQSLSGTFRNHDYKLLYQIEIACQGRRR